MSLPLVFHPDVYDEVDQAYCWYEQQRAGLGDDFLAAFDEVYRRLQQTPNDPNVYYEVALIGLRAGRPHEALHWFQNALQVDPNHAATHRALSGYYHEMGNPILSAQHRAIARQLGAPTR